MRIADTFPAGEVRPPLAQERREYVAPDGRCVLAFHTPYEWHMGAEGWELALECPGAPARDLSGLARGKGFRLPPDLQPWAANSRLAVLLTWEDPAALIYDVASGRHRAVAAKGFPLSAQWAPHRLTCLLAFADRAVLVDRQARVHATAAWTVARGEPFFSFWLPRANAIGLVARRSRRGKPRLRLYSAETGEFAGRIALDPARLAPYDAERYRDVPRMRYSLVLDDGTRAAGHLLDTWHDARFDHAADVLYLATYRPSGPAAGSGRELVCPVREVCLAVQLAG
jgi:hypothetical protein